MVAAPRGRHWPLYVAHPRPAGGRRRGRRAPSRRYKHPGVLPVSGRPHGGSRGVERARADARTIAPGERISFPRDGQAAEKRHVHRSARALTEAGLGPGDGESTEEAQAEHRELRAQGQGAREQPARRPGHAGDRQGRGAQDLRPRSPHRPATLLGGQGRTYRVRGADRLPARPRAHRPAHGRGGGEEAQRRVIPEPGLPGFPVRRSGGKPADPAGHRLLPAPAQLDQPPGRRRQPPGDEQPPGEGGSRRSRADGLRRSALRHPLRLQLPALRQPAGRDRRPGRGPDQRAGDDPRLPGHLGARHPLLPDLPARPPAARARAATRKRKLLRADRQGKRPSRGRGDGRDFRCGEPGGDHLLRNHRGQCGQYLAGGCRLSAVVCQGSAACEVPAVVRAADAGRSDRVLQLARHGRTAQRAMPQADPRGMFRSEQIFAEERAPLPAHAPLLAGRFNDRPLRALRVEWPCLSLPCRSALAGFQGRDGQAFPSESAGGIGVADFAKVETIRGRSAGPADYQCLARADVTERQALRRPNGYEGHPALHPDDHGPRRSGIRSHLRFRHDRPRRRTMGTKVDCLRHLAGGGGHRASAADDGELRLLRTGLSR